MKKYKLSLYIFTRDLRINDNTALISCIKNSEKILPIFIFTPSQITNNTFISPDKNEFQNHIQFMIESLIDLDKTLHNKYDSQLNFFYAEYIDILKDIITHHKINSIYMTFDYTPYSRNRTQILYDFTKQHSIDLNIFEDYLLHPVESIKNSSNTIYTKFTPYYDQCLGLKKKLTKPNSTLPNKKTFITTNIKKLITIIDNTNNFTLSTITSPNKIIIFNKNPHIWVHGGRTHALTTLKKAINDIIGQTEHPLHTSTNLSAYLKFGCLSIRETYNCTNDIKFHRQLYWRDFYYNILYTYPQVLHGPLKIIYKNIQWDNNRPLFEKWKTGTTGFPIIDAGMRSLNTTGFMHNRARLFTSNFLIKILLIDWRWGELYFASKLCDYDPAINNGNWQWSSGSGADSQPYFRVFNPTIQSKKYDPNTEYIKKWIPELQNVPSRHIHHWHKYHSLYPNIYHPPCVDYHQRKRHAIDTYKKIFT